MYTRMQVCKSCPQLVNYWLYSSNPQHAKLAESTYIISQHIIQVGRINLDRSRAIENLSLIHI